MSLLPSSYRLQRTLLALAFAVVTLATGAGAASARSYSVFSCDAAPGGVNRAWAPGVNNRTMKTVTRCPSRDQPERGMVISSRGREPRVPYATTAEFRFTAPAGTSLERLAFNAHFLRRVAGWRVALETNRGFLVGCQAGPGTCRGPRGRSLAALGGARWVRLVGVCLLVRGCATHSGRQPAVEARLTYAQVTVRDDDGPAYGSISGPAADSGRWHRGSEWLRFHAVDASGIKFVAATVNGHHIDFVRALRCDFTRPRPCPELDRGAFLLRTAATPFVAGRNVIRVATADGAGNVSSFTREIWIDNEAPGQPADVAAAFGEGWRPVNRFAAGWTNPGGQAAPIVAARYRLCRAGGRCEPERRVTGWSIHSLQLSVPSIGDWTLRLYLEDAAGNASWETRSAPMHMRFDDARPGRAAPAERDGWLSAQKAATQPELIQLPLDAFTPVSGIAGYSVTFDGSAPDATVDVAGRQARLSLVNLPEGAHRLRVRAVSGAGLGSDEIGETYIRIDRSRPDVSLLDSPEASTWHREPVVLRVIGTDQPGLSGMSPAPPEDARTEDGAYITYRVDRGAAQRVRGGQAVVGVSDDGPHVVTYQATDAAGNDSAERSVSFRVDRTGPETIAFDPPSPAEPRRVVVHLGDRASGAAGGQIQFRRAGEDDWTLLPTSFEQGTLVAYFPDEHLPSGTYQLRAVARDVAGNEAVGYERTDGAPAALQLPLRLGTRLTAGTGARRVRVCRRERRGRHARRRCRIVIVPGGSTVRVPLGRRTRLVGRLLTADGGRPVAGQPVVIREAVAGRRPGRAHSVLTDGAGRFAYVARAGATRVLDLRFGGTGTTKPTAAAVRLLVSARTALRVDRSHVLNGDSVLFAGRLRGGYVPPGGKIITLQAYVPGRHRWITFATPRSDRAGVWSHSYRFEATTGVVRYRFRALVPREGGYPFEPGSSPTVSVTVRGR